MTHTIAPNPPMNADALTREERSYLLGLYLTDGYLSKEGKNESREKIYYFLQANEGEIAGRVVSLLRKASLKPHIGYYGNTVRVFASSANLDKFFPNKAALLEDVSARRRFFEENGLLSSLENRVAFCAGLLDGDGSCKAHLSKPYPAKKNKNLSCVGAYNVAWFFCQIKYPFLLNYFHEFAESLATESSGFAYRKGALEAIYFRKRGMEALLKAGIANWSWKVRKCAESISKLVEERRRVREKENLERAKKVGEIGMKLRDVAKMFSLRTRQLQKWYRRGSLRATLLREGTGLGYLVVPWGEIERLRKMEHDKRWARSSLSCSTSYIWTC
nr:hypothetical protein [Candidatus Njordarchaeota archaeon]